MWTLTWKHKTNMGMHYLRKSALGYGYCKLSYFDGSGVADRKAVEHTLHEVDHSVHEVDRNQN